MVCLSCNKILSDYEASRKYVNTGTYIDLCSNCLSGLDIETMENPLLDTVTYINEEEHF